jgi:hypothetical protein
MENWWHGVVETTIILAMGIFIIEIGLLVFGFLLATGIDRIALTKQRHIQYPWHLTSELV